LTLMMNGVLRLTGVVYAIALALVTSLAQPAIAAASTERNLLRCQESASTVDFTPEMFTAMTGVAPDQGVLVVGPLVGPNTYDIVTSQGWSGTVCGPRISFTATEVGTTNSANMTGFYPAELVLPSAVGLPSSFAAITQLADTVIDCEGLSEKSCYELRRCFNTFDICMAVADSTYDIAVDECGDFSTTLTHAAGGALDARRVAYASCCVTLGGCVEFWLLTQ